MAKETCDRCGNPIDDCPTCAFRHGRSTGLKYATDRAKAFIRALVSGIERWASDEDGVPDYLSVTYKGAKDYVTVNSNLSEDGKIDLDFDALSAAISAQQAKNVLDVNGILKDTGYIVLVSYDGKVRDVHGFPEEPEESDYADIWRHTIEGIDRREVKDISLSLMDGGMIDILRVILSNNAE